MGILMCRDTSRKWFTIMDIDKSGFVDLLDWNELIAKDRRFSDLFQVINSEVIKINFASNINYSIPFFGTGDIPTVSELNIIYFLIKNDEKYSTSRRGIPTQKTRASFTQD